MNIEIYQANLWSSRIVKKKRLKTPPTSPYRALLKFMSLVQLVGLFSVLVGRNNNNNENYKQKKIFTFFSPNISYFIHRLSPDKKRIQQNLLDSCQIPFSSHYTIKKKDTLYNAILGIQKERIVKAGIT